MVKRLTEFQFKAFPHAPRPIGFDLLVEEYEWYSDDCQYTLGVLLLDKIDNDWAYAILQPSPDSGFSAVTVDHSIDERKVARAELLAAIDGVSQNFVRSTVQSTTRLVDPFTPVVPPSKLNPLFSLVSSHEGYSPARGMIREVFGAYTDRDGNFLEQFQTTGFDARIWELYLYAYLVDSGFSIQPSVSPDYIVSRLGSKVAIEAVTANPTQNATANRSQRAYSSTKLLAFPSDRVLPELDGSFEYKREDFVPIKLGSALYSKLQKRYWESANMGNIPIILAIESFHEEASLHYTSSALATYLYGFRHSYIYDLDGRLIVIPRKVDSHTFAGKTIPSGFFSLPEADNISAVLFSNSGTISKFNRMGQQGRYFNPRLTLFRSGICYDFDVDAAVPDRFSYKVGDPDFLEWWGQGLELFHNPDALHPVDRDLVPDISHHRFEDGLVLTEGPPFQPFASITYDIVSRREH